MYVGNCTDEDADYTIDNGGGGGKSCRKQKFKKDVDLKHKSKVTYRAGNKRPKIKLNHNQGDNVIVLLHKVNGVHFVTSLVLET